MMGGGAMSEDSLAANTESLRELLEHAEGGPTTICLENGHSATELNRLIDQEVGKDDGSSLPELDGIDWAAFDRFDA